jgi:hypothetical protein
MLPIQVRFPKRSHPKASVLINYTDKRAEDVNNLTPIFTIFANEKMKREVRGTMGLTIQIHANNDE